MKERKFETPLYAIAAVAAVLVLLLGANFLVSKFKLRADLTEERAFTLSEGTRKVLAGLKSPVQGRF